jgi:hypothetical protein
MNRIRVAVAWTVVLFGISCTTTAQRWQDPPSEVRAAQRKLFPELQKAMDAGDEARVHAVVKEIQKALGPWAGHTEVETKYYKPVNAGPPPSMAAISEGWEALHKSTEAEYKGHGQWGHAGPVPLRESASVVVGYSYAVKAGAKDRDTLLQRIREGLDYMLSVQASNGVFPFPDVRGKDPFFGPMLEKQAAQNPKAFQNGWVIDDDGDGGLQFDNGVAGTAMLEGYDLLRDRKYLDAARRAADWAAKHELVSNFNYNSFSVWLLAGVYRETGESTYLDAAIQKAHLGVLPGEMENGRWVDLHNARPAYHWIMILALLELRDALPSGNKVEPEVRDHLTSAIDNGAREILDNGAPSLETPFAVLPLVCQMPGAKPEWRKALDVLINGVFDAAHGDPKQIHGLSPYGYASYLLYRTNQK